MTSGRKIPPSMENPFDNIILFYVEKVNPYLRRLGVTPNMLTTCSLIFGILSPLLIYKGWFGIGAILFLIAYVFDCMDGNMARAFDMVTVFGDYYDHATDIIQIVLFVIAILMSPMRYEHKVSMLVTATILFCASFIHIGCQEKVYGYQVPCLQVWEKLCPNPDIIYTTRYFGTGTMIMFVVIFLLILSVLKDHIGGQCKV
jgi:phosphatidylglycerophosphate synthase